jgi:hypothetical protein
VRKGVQPDTNALAPVLVVATIAGRIVDEGVRRLEVRRAEARVAIRAGEAVAIAPAAAR